ADISNGKKLIAYHHIGDFWEGRLPSECITSSLHICLIEALSRCWRVDKLQDVTEENAGKFWAILKNVEPKDNIL
ncbi:9268_t:CDS:2, partial [Paraglomus brasilianum]